MKEHKWDGKALDYLVSLIFDLWSFEGLIRDGMHKMCFFLQRAIQLNALEDRSIHDRKSWDTACNFMYKAAAERLSDVQSELKIRICFT